jgi:hypothetical protein
MRDENHVFLSPEEDFASSVNRLVARLVRTGIITRWEGALIRWYQREHPGADVALSAMNLRLLTKARLNALCRTLAEDRSNDG